MGFTTRTSSCLKIKSKLLWSKLNSLWLIKALTLSAQVELLKAKNQELIAEKQEA